MPLASSLNYAAGQTIANSAMAQIGSNGQVCIFTLQPAHVVVDVDAYFTSASSFIAIAPSRLLDTRPGASTVDGQFAGAGTAQPGSVTAIKVSPRVGVPSRVAAISLNVTITNPQGPGFVVLFPCGTPMPPTSDLNYAAGQTIAKAAVVAPNADGWVCAYTLAQGDLVIDANGYMLG